jgi:hypothetical protein
MQELGQIISLAAILQKGYFRITENTENAVFEFGLLASRRGGRPRVARSMFSANRARVDCCSHCGMNHQWFCKAAKISSTEMLATVVALSLIA